MRERLAQLVADRLKRDEAALRQDFHATRGAIKTRYFAVDDLLPPEIAHEIHRAFPADRRSFRRLESFRERKSTSKNLESLPPILAEITFAFQAKGVVEAVERITGIANQMPDPHLYAGGLSMMAEGDFLNPHLDNSHDMSREAYRTANLLYYVSPGWAAEHGGNFELWDLRVRERVEIVSRFNRLLVMETNAESWHSVNPVRVARARCCVSNYYFSPDPPGGVEHFHVTEFSARPDQKVRRVVAAADRTVRRAVRRVIKLGVGRKDVYLKPE
jgi:Rps23 Pro-64 3,4-dihydroxylase Tpa1-like proline 4-hydroxylase